MTKKTRTGVYKAKEGFATSHKGQMLMVGAGALVPSELPYDVMDGREHLFVDIATVRSMEQATAAPGEKRAVQVPDVEVEDDEVPPKSGPGSGRDAWAVYAEAQGVEVTDDMTRDEIIDVLEA